MTTKEKKVEKENKGCSIAVPPVIQWMIVVIYFPSLVPFFILLYIAVSLGLYFAWPRMLKNKWVTVTYDD